MRDLHFYPFVPVMKDHLPHKTTFCGPVGWCVIEGFTVHWFPVRCRMDYKDFFDFFLIKILVLKFKALNAMAPDNLYNYIQLNVCIRSL